MILPCSFDLHFSNNQRYWASCHVPVDMTRMLTCMYSLEKSLFRFSAYFLIELFVSLLLSSMNYLCILEIKPLLVS